MTGKNKKRFFCRDHEGKEVHIGDQTMENLAMRGAGSDQDQYDFVEEFDQLFVWFGNTKELHYSGSKHIVLDCGANIIIDMSEEGEPMGLEIIDVSGILKTAKGETRTPGEILADALESGEPMTDADRQEMQDKMQEKAAEIDPNIEVTFHDKEEDADAETGEADPTKAEEE